MKKYFFILISVFMFTNSNAGVKNRVLDPIGEFFINQKVITVIDYSSAIGYVFYNSRVDAGIWQKISNINNGITYNEKASIEHFHYNKNMANVALIFKGYALSIQIKECIEGNLTWKRFFGRQICQLFLDNFIWHTVYNYSRYGNYFPVDAKYNGSRYVIPFPGKEIKIGLSGNQVKWANGIEFGIGIFPLFSFDFPLSFLE